MTGTARAAAALPRGPGQNQAQDVTKGTLTGSGRGSVMSQDPEHNPTGMLRGASESQPAEQLSPTADGCSHDRRPLNEQLHVFSAHLFAEFRVGVSVGQGYAELLCAALTPDCK